MLRQRRASSWLVGWVFCLMAQVAALPAMGQTVRSKPATASAVSGLLQVPGQEHNGYEEPVDWSRLPAWQQTSFFGLRARGHLFVYVVDASGSMVDNGRMMRAKQELRRSVGALQSPQRFVVIFYNDRPMPMAGGLPMGADAASKARLASWLRVMGADGATDPRSAMAMALGLQPDAIFLLSDGEFPEGTAQAISSRNRNQVPIHTVDMGSGGGAAAAVGQLREISRASGGQHAARP